MSRSRPEIQLMWVLRSIACGYGCAQSLFFPKMLHNPDTDLEMKTIGKWQISVTNFKAISKLLIELYKKEFTVNHSFSLIRFSSLLYRLMERRFSSTLNKDQQGLETWTSTGPCGLEELAKINRALQLEGTCICYHGLFQCPFFNIAWHIDIITSFSQRFCLGQRRKNLVPFGWLIFWNTQETSQPSLPWEDLTHLPATPGSPPVAISSYCLAFILSQGEAWNFLFFSGIAPVAGSIWRHNIDGAEVPAVLHHWSSGGNAAQLMPCF